MSTLTLGLTKISETSLSFFHGKYLFTVMCDNFVLRLPFNRYKRDLVNTLRRKEQPFHDFTFCQMMNCWRFCLKPKILLLFNLICASALKISPGYVRKNNSNNAEDGFHENVRAIQISCYCVLKRTLHLLNGNTLRDSIYFNR